MNDADKALLNALADRRRRYTLAVLAARDRPADADDLAAAVARAEAESEAVTDEKRRRVLTDLHHVHLPKLERGGLVARSDEGFVATIDAAALESEYVTAALASPASVSRTEEKVFAALGHERRRIVASLLRDADEAVPLDELGAAVVARERDADAAEIPIEAVEPALVTLHHAHLPKLADAGLLEYDEENRTVRPRGLSGTVDEERFSAIAIEGASGAEEFLRH